MSELLKLQFEFCYAVALLIQKAHELGYTATIGTAYREPEQAVIDASKGTGIVRSLHCDKLAIDLNLFREGVYITDGSRLTDLGLWWKSLGTDYRWGGDFSNRPDGNHFSITPDNLRA